LPFRAQHCGYCDFAMAVHRDDRRGDYLCALGQEMQKLEMQQAVDTLFFGGGCAAAAVGPPGVGKSCLPKR
jgi:oxygen-independent coproporphyrinogen-3 oxidase